MSQISEIENYLKKHKKGISSKEAFEKFGATRLSAIIYVLKHKRGLKIESKLEKTKNRYGHTTVYSRYVVVQD